MRPTEKELKQQPTQAPNSVNTNGITHSPRKMGDFGILPLEVFAYILSWIRTSEDIKSLIWTNTFFHQVTQRLPRYIELKANLKTAVATTEMIVLMSKNPEFKKHYLANIHENTNPNQIREGLISMPPESLAQTGIFFQVAKNKHNVIKGTKYMCGDKLDALEIGIPIFVCFLVGAIAAIFGACFHAQPLFFIGLGLACASVILGVISFFLKRCLFRYGENTNLSDNPIADLNFDNSEQPLLDDDEHNSEKTSLNG